MCIALWSFDAHAEQEGPDFILNWKPFVCPETPRRRSQPVGKCKQTRKPLLTSTIFDLEGAAPRGYASIPNAWQTLKITDIHNSGPVVKKPHFVKNGRKIRCNTDNCVPLVVFTVFTSSTSESQEALQDVEINSRHAPWKASLSFLDVFLVHVESSLCTSPITNTMS